MDLSAKGGGGWGKNPFYVTQCKSFYVDARICKDSLHIFVGTRASVPTYYWVSQLKHLETSICIFFFFSCSKVQKVKFIPHL